MIHKIYSEGKDIYHTLVQMGVQPQDSYLIRRRKRTLNVAALMFTLGLSTHFIRSILLSDLTYLLLDITLGILMFLVIRLNRKNYYERAIFLWSLSTLAAVTIIAFRAENQEPANFAFLLLSLTHFSLLSKGWKHGLFHSACLILFLASTYYHRKYLPFNEEEFLPLILFVVIFFLFLRFLENEHINYQETLEKQKQQILQQKDKLTVQNELLTTSRQKEKELYDQLLAAKDRELTTHTLSAVERQRILKPIVDKLAILEKALPEEKHKEMHEIRKVLHNHLDGNNWNQFLFHFEKVHPGFFKELKGQFPHLTNNDLKVSAYLKVGMGNAEIAQMVGITTPSLKNNLNRLKKKLSLEAKDSLREFVMGV